MEVDREVAAGVAAPSGRYDVLLASSSAGGEWSELDVARAERLDVVVLAEGVAKGLP